MLITRDIYPDTARKNNFRVILAKQFDENSRYLRAVIQNEGRRVNINDKCSVVFNVKRADGKMRAILGSVNKDGSVQVPLTQWLLSVVGTAICSISIIEGEENKLTTMSFEVQVEQQEYIENGDITEDENYDILVDLIAEVTELKNDTTEATDSANKATELANSAADAANSAAKAAREVAEGLENAAERAETATENANNAAKSASDNAQKAETSARNADSAAERANTAAGEIEGAVANASEALKQATDAAKNAEQATTDAQAAVSAANEAIDKADTSSAAAEKAAENANNAANKALDAVTSIESSVEKAEQAVKDAETATTTATEAAANAEKAIEAANTAKAEADAATKTANDAAGVATAAAGAATSAARNANDAATSANQAIEELSGAAQEATEAATNASSAADSATTAAGLANSAAEKCESAATSATNAATSANQVAERVETAITGANEAATSATKAGETATQAAESCNTAAAKAEGAAEQCNTATESANSAASAANEAATKADTAAGNAEKAAAEANKWANVTATAKTLDAGAEATATLTETEDGKQFEFGIPKGEKGDTADLSKYATKEDLNNKVDKDGDKQLSTNDYTNEDKQKLTGIETGAEVNAIESVKVNGVALVPDETKAVDVKAYNEDNKPEVGGRNYLIGTKNGFIYEPQKQYTYNFGQCASQEIRDSLFGKQITLSLDYDVNIENGKVRIAWSEIWNTFKFFESQEKGHLQITTTLSNTASLSANSNILYMQREKDYDTTSGVIKLSNVKLELGEIATDWTPAPEDIEAEIKEVEDKVDGIEIGGRNYILNSKEFKYNTNVAHSGAIYIGKVSNEQIWQTLYDAQVTISFDYDCDVTSGHSDFGIDIAYFKITTFTNNTPKSGHFSKTVDVPKSDGSSHSFTYIYIQNTNFIGNINFYNIKVELGNKETDWSPAPEDLETTAENFEGILPIEKGGTGNAKSKLKDLSTYSRTETIGLAFSGDTISQLDENAIYPILATSNFNKTARDIVFCSVTEPYFIEKMHIASANALASTQLAIASLYETRTVSTALADMAMDIPTIEYQLTALDKNMVRVYADLCLNPGIEKTIEDVPEHIRVYVSEIIDKTIKERESQKLAKDDTEIFEAENQD